MRCGAGSCVGGKATLICRFGNGRSCCHHGRRACPVEVEKRTNVSFVILLLCFCMFCFRFPPPLTPCRRFLSVSSTIDGCFLQFIHLVYSSSRVSFVSPFNTDSLPFIFLLFHLSSILNASQNISTNLSRVNPLSREGVVVGTHNGDCVCDVVSMFGIGGPRR